MATIYSTLFGSGFQVGAGSGTFYTVPAASVAIVRSVQLDDVGHTAQNFIIADGGNLSIAHAEIAAAPWFYDWEGRSVLDAGETLQWLSDGGDWTWRVSGYLLNA